MDRLGPSEASNEGREVREALQYVGAMLMSELITGNEETAPGGIVEFELGRVDVVPGENRISIDFRGKHQSWTVGELALAIDELRPTDGERQDERT